MSTQIIAQEITDEWSGMYRLEPYGKVSDSIAPKQFYNIQKIVLEHDNSTSLYHLSIPDQWIIKNMANNDDQKVLRAFSFSEKKNDYEEFGWTTLYKKGAIKCVDGGNLFICKTKPKTKISFGNDQFISNSGTFGILLHYGIFELYKSSSSK
ncbi:hypothetical protein [Tenacibaculum agarivorans]|uniref:hypothetical protein n=1 Tax=Tenacibaculum agarivorans TaxID=1908389 RepID=UPI00094BC011|nr:hypothetical protein [Tenacibaculum agarivorans]